MAKYVFIQSFKIMGMTSGCVAGGNCPPIPVIQSFSIGDCIDGRADKITSKDGTEFDIIYILANDGLEYGVEPQYLKLNTGEKCKTNIFSTKNVIIGIIIVVVIIISLKLLKIY